jgi:hypothetical protein
MPSRIPHVNAKSASGQDPSLPTDDNKIVLRGPELHDDAPKRVTKQHTAIIETEMVKTFHPERVHGGGNHNNAPKRVTTPAGITITGAECYAFA